MPEKTQSSKPSDADSGIEVEVEKKKEAPKPPPGPPKYKDELRGPLVIRLLGLFNLDHNPVVDTSQQKEFDLPPPPKSRFAFFTKLFKKNKPIVAVESKDEMETQFQEIRNQLTFETIHYPRDFELGDDEIFAGEGANGKVFVLTNKVTKKIYAVKRFCRDEGIDPNTHYKSFMREALISLCLKHPNTAISVDVGFCNASKSFCILMEAYPTSFAVLVGISNPEMGVTRKPPGITQLDHHFRQAISALEYLHDNGIAHRDLKLENFCMTSQGQTKVIDFGSSVLFNPPEPAWATDIAGTDPYLAPELLQLRTTKRYDAKPSDVWSMGIVYIAMTQRTLPWSLPTPDQSAYSEYITNPLQYVSNQFRNWERSALPKHILVSMLDPDVKSRTTFSKIMESEWYRLG